jgi:hypothetical protein
LPLIGKLIFPVHLHLDSADWTDTLGEGLAAACNPPSRDILASKVRFIFCWCFLPRESSSTQKGRSRMNIGCRFEKTKLSSHQRMLGTALFRPHTGRMRPPGHLLIEHPPSEAAMPCTFLQGTITDVILNLYGVVGRNWSFARHTRVPLVTCFLPPHKDNRDISFRT